MVKSACALSQKYWINSISSWGSQITFLNSSDSTPFERNLTNSRTEGQRTCVNKCTLYFMLYSITATVTLDITLHGLFYFFVYVLKVVTRAIFISH